MANPQADLIPNREATGWLLANKQWTFDRQAYPAAPEADHLLALLSATTLGGLEGDPPALTKQKGPRKR